MQHTGQQSRKHTRPGCPSHIFYKDTGYNAMLISMALSFSVPDSSRNAPLMRQIKKMTEERLGHVDIRIIKMYMHVTEKMKQRSEERIKNLILLDICQTGA